MQVARPVPSSSRETLEGVGARVLPERNDTHNVDQPKNLIQQVDPEDAVSYVSIRVFAILAMYVGYARSEVKHRVPR